MGSVWRDGVNGPVIEDLGWCSTDEGKLRGFLRRRLESMMDVNWIKRFVYFLCVFKPWWLMSCSMI